MTKTQLDPASPMQSNEPATPRPRLLPSNPSRTITTGVLRNSSGPPTHYEPERGFAFRAWDGPGRRVSDLDRRSGVPTRRLWRGFAARSAGVDALRSVAPDGSETKKAGMLRHSRHFGGMERKAPSPSFFTERTLADFLAVSDRTVRNWIRRGELPSYKLGAARRIDPADVEDFLARHRDEAA